MGPYLSEMDPSVFVAEIVSLLVLFCVKRLHALHNIIGSAGCLFYLFHVWRQKYHGEFNMERDISGEEIPKRCRLTRLLSIPNSCKNLYTQVVWHDRIVVAYVLLCALHVQNPTTWHDCRSLCYRLGEWGCGWSPAPAIADSSSMEHRVAPTLCPCMVINHSYEWFSFFLVSARRTSSPGR